MTRTELKRQVAQWQSKRQRLKRTITALALALLALLVVVGAKWMQGQEIRWAVVASLFAVFGLLAVGSLMAYTNTALVTMYYSACDRSLEAPEELELVTGTVAGMDRVQMPYIGALYHVTLHVAGEEVRYYCPARLLCDVQPQARIRLRTHDLFAMRVEHVSHQAS